MALFGILALYSFGRAGNLLRGPEIAILSPQNGESFKNDLIKISGNAKNAALIYLNDRQIFTDEDGSFGENILLHYGYNIIEISAEDRFGTRETKTLNITYQ